MKEMNLENFINLLFADYNFLRNFKVSPLDIGKDFPQYISYIEKIYEFCFMYLKEKFPVYSDTIYSKNRIFIDDCNGNTYSIIMNKNNDKIKYIIKKTEKEEIREFKQQSENVYLVNINSLEKNKMVRFKVKGNKVLLSSVGDDVLFMEKYPNVDLKYEDHSDIKINVKKFID